MRLDRGVQPVPGGGVAGDGLLDMVEDALHALLVDRQQQRLLVGNVEIDRARRHRGRRGEFADGGRVIALLGKSRRRRIQQRRPAVRLPFCFRRRQGSNLSRELTERLFSTWNCA